MVDCSGEELDWDGMNVMRFVCVGGVHTVRNGWEVVYVSGM